MRQRDRISLGFGVAALLVAVLFVGGALRPSQAVVAFLVAIALGTQLFARRRLANWSPLVVFFSIAIGLTAIQLVPLPEGLRSALNPVGETLRQDGAALANTDPWPSLSLDPAGTTRALSMLVILLGVGVVALRFAASDRGKYWLLATTAGTCGLAALVTGAHTIANTDSLYGIYTPAHASPHVLGPLLNGNHLGCLMSLGAVLSIGLAFHVRQRSSVRVFWIFNTIACLLVDFATLSRGAALGFVVGAVIAIGTLIAQRLDAAQRRKRSSGFGSQLPVAITIAFGLGLAIYGSAGRVASQLDNTSMVEFDHPSSKYAAWKSSVRLVTETPWTGIGRGAFEPVFARVHEPAAYVTFSHLENEYLQAVVDWGIPGAIALAIAFCWCALRAFRRWKDGPLAAAALGAISAVLLQSTVDFGLEILGVAVPATMVAATLLAVPLREPTHPKRPRAIRAGLVLALLIAGVVVLLPSARSVQEDHDDLIANPQATLDDVRTVIERHPLDYFGYGQAGSIMLRTDAASTVRYLNHAMTLHPTHPGLHRLVARMLVATNRPSQAAVQYALALDGTTAPGKLLAEVLRALPNVDHAAAALPIDGNSFEPIYRALKDMKRDDVILRWLVRAITVPRHDTSVIDRLYDLAVQRREYETAELAARTRLQNTRTNASRLMLAKVFSLQQEDGLVLSELSDVASWKGVLVEKMQAWLLVCDVHSRRKDWDKALRCLDQLDGSGTVTLGSRSELTRRYAQIKDQRNLEQHEKAIEELERSVRGKPSK